MPAWINRGRMTSRVDAERLERRVEIRH